MKNRDEMEQSGIPHIPSHTVLNSEGFNQNVGLKREPAGLPECMSSLALQ